jgi:hypothetical protein
VEGILPIAEAPRERGRLLSVEDLREILRLAGDPHVCVPELIGRLERAPALAEEVRRVADSSLYGMPGKITRLERAVLIVGVGAVAEICAALWARDRLERDRWTHRLEVAVAGRLIAEHLDPALRMPAWVAGVLHGGEATRLVPDFAGSPLEVIVSAAHLLESDPVCAVAATTPELLDDLGLLPDDVADLRARAEGRTKEALRIFAG